MKWYNMPLWFIKTLDFIKNTLLIYIIFSFVAWDFNIENWWIIWKILFVFFTILNLKISYE